MKMYCFKTEHCVQPSLKREKLQGDYSDEKYLLYWESRLEKTSPSGGDHSLSKHDATEYLSDPGHCKQCQDDEDRAPGLKELTILW